MRASRPLSNWSNLRSCGRHRGGTCSIWSYLFSRHPSWSYLALKNLICPGSNRIFPLYENLEGDACRTYWQMVWRVLLLSEFSLVDEQPWTFVLFALPITIWVVGLPSHQSCFFSIDVLLSFFHKVVIVPQTSSRGTTRILILFGSPKWLRRAWSLRWGRPFEALTPDSDWCSLWVTRHELVLSPEPFFGSLLETGSEELLHEFSSQLLLRTHWV